MINKAAIANDESYWLLGAIGLFESTRLHPTQIDSSFIPYIAWESGGLHLGIDELSYEFGARDDFRWTLIAKPRYSLDSESARFDELERDFALELGGSLAVGFYPWVVSATLLSDVSGSHNGQSAEFAISQSVPFGVGEFEYEIGAVYQSNELALHLYGISAMEATAVLSAYEPGGVWKPFITGSYFIDIGHRTGVQIQLELNSLPDKVANSERIDEVVQAEGYIAIVRQF